MKPGCVGNYDLSATKDFGGCKVLHITTDDHQFDPANITVDDIRIRDIIQTLPMICRYNGFVKRFYSVAQHSVLVTELAEKDDRTEEICRAALVHDFSEAWLGDVTTPVKRELGNYRSLEYKAFVAVCQRFALSPYQEPVWEAVRHYDMLACYMEAKSLAFRDYSWIKLVPDRYWETRQGGMLRDPKCVIYPEEARDLLSRKCAEYGVC